MIYSILCGIMGIVFTILLYCSHLLDQKQMQPRVDVVLDFEHRVDDLMTQGSEIAKNLEAQQVTVDNLVARVAKVDNLVARVAETENRTVRPLVTYTSSDGHVWDICDKANPIVFDILYGRDEKGRVTKI